MTIRNWHDYAKVKAETDQIEAELRVDPEQFENVEQRGGKVLWLTDELTRRYALMAQYRDSAFRDRMAEEPDDTTSLEDLKEWVRENWKVYGFQATIDGATGLAIIGVAVLSHQSVKGMILLGVATSILISTAFRTIMFAFIRTMVNKISHPIPKTEGDWVPPQELAPIQPFQLPPSPKLSLCVVCGQFFPILSDDRWARMAMCDTCKVTSDAKMPPKVSLIPDGWSETPYPCTVHEHIEGQCQPPCMNPATHFRFHTGRRILRPCCQAHAENDKGWEEGPHL